MMFILLFMAKIMWPAFTLVVLLFFFFYTCKHSNSVQFSSIQFSSIAQTCLTLCDSMDPQHTRLPCPSPTSGACSNYVHRVCDAIQLCHPASIFPGIRVFPSESVLHIRWPKYWSFSFSIRPSNEYSGLISLRIDWFDLLAVQETLKSLLQHHSSKASILRCSAFLIVQLSHPYMTTGKTIALTRWTLVGKVMSLLFNTRSRLIITFLPRRSIF